MSFVEFIEMLSPFWDLAREIFSFQIFGAPLYGILLSLFLMSFILSFIKGGHVGSGLTSSISAGVRAGEAAKAERQFKELKERLGFGSRED